MAVVDAENDDNWLWFLSNLRLAWSVYGFPCEHDVWCIFMRGENVYSYADPYFGVRAFELSYSRAIQPVSSSTKPDEILGIADMVPPATKRPSGRPNSKRKTSIGEFSKKKATTGECLEFELNTAGVITTAITAILAKKLLVSPKG